MFLDPILLVSLAIIGRFGVTVAYNSGAQYATELIPTCVRGQGVAAVHVAGYALTFFSSYILYLVRLFLCYITLKTMPSNFVYFLQSQIFGWHCLLSYWAVYVWPVPFWYYFYRKR